MIPDAGNPDFVRGESKGATSFMKRMFYGLLAALAIIAAPAASAANAASTSTESNHFMENPK